MSDLRFTNKEYEELKKVLYTPSSNDTSSTALSELTTPVAPQVKEGQSLSSVVGESAVSDQDGAKPSFSVQSFDRKSPDSEPAGTGREGGKPSTSISGCCDSCDELALSIRKTRSEMWEKAMREAHGDVREAYKIYGSYYQESFSSGKGESGSVTANASGNHSAAYQQGGLTEPDENGGKSGGESASVQPTSFTATSVSPRPEESIVGWPRNEAEAAAWEKAKRSYIQNVTPEKAVRADERRKVLDEVEARIVFLEDAKKRYSTSSRHACDLLIREHRFMLGAMRK